MHLYGFASSASTSKAGRTRAHAERMATHRHAAPYRHPWRRCHSPAGARGTTGSAALTWNHTASPHRAEPPRSSDHPPRAGATAAADPTRAATAADVAPGHSEHPLPLRVPLPLMDTCAARRRTAPTSRTTASWCCFAPACWLGRTRAPARHCILVD